MLRQPANRQRIVVSVGKLPELLSLRPAVLKSAGYAVFTTTDPQEAVTKSGKRNAECCCCAIRYLTYGGRNWCNNSASCVRKAVS